jgi:hypothetical protein
VKVAADAETIRAELERRGIAYRLEPRAMGFEIPVVDDPEGNMVELFPNIDHVPLPGKAFCPPEQVDVALEALRRGFDEMTGGLDPQEGVPLLLFERYAAQQQQQQ